MNWIEDSNSLRSVAVSDLGELAVNAPCAIKASLKTTTLTAELLSHITPTREPR